jgi:hypothetical protein
MGHSVGKGTLQQDFGCNALQLRFQFEVPCQVCERFVKMGDSRGEVGQQRRAVSATSKEIERTPERHPCDESAHAVYEREVGLGTLESPVARHEVLSASCRLEQPENALIKPAHDPRTAPLSG